MLRRKGNASHFQNNARSGKSSLKQGATGGSILRLLSDEGEIPARSDRDEDRRAARDCPEMGRWMLGIPLKIGSKRHPVLKTPEKLDESLQLD
jgi:hypothetical protein